jgi:hypothetical protein
MAGCERHVEDAVEPMSLLVTPEQLRVRTSVAQGPLSGLATSLAADLRPLLAHELHFPEKKALLSREGGRCALDGTLLEFDPFIRHEHRCPKCGTIYRGELHDRFWIYWYQLWLAERAVHASLLAVLGIDNSFAGLAESILSGYADRYASYPNSDNVLGPTRLFFSTYLESIWLLQICIATDLLASLNPSLADRIRSEIIEPSRAIIAEYNEGGSNRQVWNDAALLAAAMSVGDRTSAEKAVFGAAGVVSHLATGLLADGTWYEGENYHLFAHRGLWYGVTLAERAGLEIPRELAARFQTGFATPFISALPDFTFPSRRDSQYAVSLRQWRIAEHCELGLARGDDPILVGALERMYCDDVPRRESNRRTSSADAERNGPATSLTRADLSWRALMFARRELPPLEPYSPQSALLERQGLAVFRRESGRIYAALDYGNSGGGHGHPDRLNLLLSDGNTRWLDDYGTGSYVDPTLHWYRSTLAHNAPLVNGVSQERVDGDLLAYDERGAAGWIEASARFVNSLPPFGVVVTRTVIAMSGYLVDELSWSAPEPVTLDLPFHADFIVDRLKSTDATLDGGQGTEDGFRFVRETSVLRSLADDTVRLDAVATDDSRLAVWLRPSTNVELWRTIAPGPPGAADRAFLTARMHGATGRLRSVVAWSSEVQNVSIDREITVSLTDASSHVHQRIETGWHIALQVGEAQSSIDLERRAPVVIAATSVETAIQNAPGIELSRRGAPTTIELGELHYRRSEQSWTSAGGPSARLTLSYVDAPKRQLRITIDVAQSERTFSPAESINPYDNENADINGDGAQLYLSSDEGLSAWMLVPQSGSTIVRTRQLEQWPANVAMSAVWSATPHGYTIDVEIDHSIPKAIDILINEKPLTRERRRGQLILSGGRGEFVYLRGDRHEPTQLVPIRLTDE